MMCKDQEEKGKYVSSLQRNEHMKLLLHVGMYFRVLLYAVLVWYTTFA